MPSLENSRLKLKRAKEHLEALDTELRVFMESTPYTIEQEEGLQQGRYHFRLKTIRTPPSCFGLLIGDAVHNLRSALDALAWQLALLTTEFPNKKIGFPIFCRRNDGEFRKKVKAFPPRAQDIIETLQPYHAGNSAEKHILWVLHTLDIANKHKVVPTTIVQIRRWYGDGAIYLGMKASLLDNGDIDFTWDSQSPEPELDPHSSVTVVFDMPGPANGTEITGIQRIYDFIANEVLPRFADFFPKE
jgi:hypothetical protein